MEAESSFQNESGADIMKLLGLHCTLLKPSSRPILKSFEVFVTHPTPSDWKNTEGKTLAMGNARSSKCPNNDVLLRSLDQATPASFSRQTVRKLPTK